MAYKGKNPRPQNGGNNNGSRPQNGNNNGAGAITCSNCGRNGHLAQDCRSRPNNGSNNNNNNANNGMKHCENCGDNRSHVTADCFKNKNKSNNNGDSTKVPSRPCSHCGGAHYDNQCNNNVFGDGNQNQNQGQGHGQQNQHQPQAFWQTQTQIFNTPCLYCGEAHQASQCPQRPARQVPAYLSTTIEVYEALVSNLHQNPANATSIYQSWELQQQQQQQQLAQMPRLNVVAMQQASVEPMMTWMNGGENVQYADLYEETSSFERLSIHEQGQGQNELYADVDRDGDSVMVW